jgi:glutathione S-transferase
VHPQPGLTDRDAPYDYHRMLAFNAFLGSSLHPAIGKVLFSRPPLEGEAKTAAVELALSKYDLVEQHLFTGPWVLGEIYSAADGYLSVFTRWARAAQLLDPARYPKLNAHLDAVQARPAVQRVLMQEGLQPV